MSTSTVSLMDFLSAIFFIIAGIWLLAAIIYSLMVLYFLRLRSLQLLHIIHDESFGRLYIFPKCGDCRSCCCRRHTSNDHSPPNNTSNNPTTTTTTTTTTQSQQQPGSRGQREYYYISLGWIFRRYARHLNLDVTIDYPERDASQQQQSRPRYKRSERRAAIQLLLLQQQQQQKKMKPTPITTWMKNHVFGAIDSSIVVVDAASTKPSQRRPDDLSQIELGILTTTNTTTTTTSNPLHHTIIDNDDDGVPICSICLGPYEEHDDDEKEEEDEDDDVVVGNHPRNIDTLQPSSSSSSSSQPVASSNTTTVFQSSTCCHVFHMECLLNWLQRPNNTACPCCRIPMLEETNIWNMIVQLRKQKRRQQRKLAQQQQQQLLSSKQQKPNDVVEGPMEDTTNSETEHDGV